jgi:mannosyl-glycoprotein endo-beta-N-acetylglucosaminidase
LTDAVKFDEYRFYNWAGCDIFCYFSHRFITIPTLQWLNAAHKHGVKVLGTFIVEWDDGKKMINEQILSSLTEAKLVADALVYIAKACNFEGWLINIESAVEEANVPVLM